MSSQLADQELLIPGRQSARCLNPIFFCYFTKLLSYLPYVILLILSINSFTAGLLTTLLSLIDFWFTQNIHGFDLIGLSWSLSSGTGFSYVSKPDPFMPTHSDSNFFWLSFFIFIILWAITFFVSLLTSGIFRAIIPAFSTMLHFFNLLMFMRAYRSAISARDLLALQQAAEIEGITFELVQDDPPAPILKPFEEEDESEVI